MASLAATLGVAQKADAPPRVSTEPLTAEQVAIYRAVLLDYVKDTKQWLNLADTTGPLRLSGPTAAGGCDPGFVLETEPAPNLPLHQIDARVAHGISVTLVDPTEQAARIKKSNTQEHVQGEADGSDSSGQELDETERRAFRNGLFTLTEIAFDPRHQRAVVGYSFVCGELCGHGETLVLEKVAGKWKISRMCGEWVS